MALSGIEKRRWGGFAFAIADWAFFVCNVPSDLNYPWNVVSILLGLLSPFWWYKALNVSYPSQPGSQGESTNVAATRQRIVSGRPIYVAVGAVSWGVFVHSVPPHPVDSQLVLRGILGFFSPFLWSVAAFLNMDNSLFWWICLGIDNKSTDEREPQTSNRRDGMGFASFLSAWAA